MAGPRGTPAAGSPFSQAGILMASGSWSRIPALRYSHACLSTPACSRDGSSWGAAGGVRASSLPIISKHRRLRWPILPLGHGDRRRQSRCQIRHSRSAVNLPVPQRTGDSSCQPHQRPPRRCLHALCTHAATEGAARVPPTDQAGGTRPDPGQATARPIIDDPHPPAYSSQPTHHRSPSSTPLSENSASRELSGSTS